MRLIAKARSYNNNNFTTGKEDWQTVQKLDSQNMYYVANMFCTDTSVIFIPRFVNMDEISQGCRICLLFLVQVTTARK